ncbi:ATP-dependent endonuclease [Acidobacteriota bacterium]
MINECAKFRGYRCFSKKWAGFDVIRPINIIIGKNNSGKSCLLDLLDQIITRKMTMADYRISGILTESDLRKGFKKNTSGGPLRGDHWRDHGIHFVDKPVEWVMNRTGKVEDVQFKGDFDYISSRSEQSSEARLQFIKEIFTKKRPSHYDRTFRRLVADRDIAPEIPDINMTLSENGVGATNIIRRFITSSSEKYQREIIQRDLLEALNKILGKDTEFTEIGVQEHDETEDDQQKEKWEIFFGEKQKGLISLSRSGSGLKTIILVLLNLLVIPKIENSQPTSYVFSFEELENNLHPSALRRLLAFIEEFSLEHQCPIFLTTHSNVTLDFFSTSKHAQIVHVVHNGEYAVSHTISAHFDKLNIISDLGAKPSDLFQANGIVWVEGPSDRIYFNK